MAETPGVLEPTTRRADRRLPARVPGPRPPGREDRLGALRRLNRRMNVAYGPRPQTLGISNAEWEVLKASSSPAPPTDGPSDLAEATRPHSYREDPPHRPHASPRESGSSGDGTSPTAYASSWSSPTKALEVAGGHAPRHRSSRRTCSRTSSAEEHRRPGRGADPAAAQGGARTAGRRLAGLMVKDWASTSQHPDSWLPDSAPTLDP